MWMFVNIKVFMFIYICLSLYVLYYLYEYSLWSCEDHVNETDKAFSNCFIHMFLSHMFKNPLNIWLSTVCILFIYSLQSENPIDYQSDGSLRTKFRLPLIQVIAMFHHWAAPEALILLVWLHSPVNILPQHMHRWRLLIGSIHTHVFIQWVSAPVHSSTL